MASGSDDVEMKDLTNNTDCALILNEFHKLKSKDMHAAKSWLLAVITTHPKNFDLHFEAYLMEKKDNNFIDAGKYFSYIVKTFPSRIKDIWGEIDFVIQALRTKETEITSNQEFYWKMFEYTNQHTQNSLALLAISSNRNSYNELKQLLLNLKRYPLSILKHLGRLLEIITNGMKNAPHDYERIFMDEVMPLLSNKVPKLSPDIVCRLFVVFCQYYLRKIIDEENYEDDEIWRNIFQILYTSGRLLRWKKFLPFNRTWSHKIYWDKLMEIKPNCGQDRTQIIYYGTTLFVYSLFCYMPNCSIREGKQHLCHMLVEGFINRPLDGRGEMKHNGPPQISLTTPISQTLSSAFLHAAKCWQLLNGNRFRIVFSALLATLPLSSWISRFLFDLAIYYGHKDKAKSLMKDITITNALVKDLVLLNHSNQEGLLTLESFNCILNILRALPNSVGQFMDHLTVKASRNLIFLPLNQSAILQYCVRSIIRVLTVRLCESDYNDKLLGDLIILLQLDYPLETKIIEQIFSIIAKRRTFVFRNFTTYLITIDFIEEFMFLFNKYSDMNFDFSPNPNALSTKTATEGTPHTEKTVRDNFLSIIKQQILRCNDNITQLLINFIINEKTHLIRVICRGGANANLIHLLS